MTRTLTTTLAAAILASAPSFCLAQYEQILAPNQTNGGNALLTAGVYVVADGTDVYSGAAKPSVTRELELFANTVKIADLSTIASDGVSLTLDRVTPGVGTRFSSTEGVVVFDQSADQIVSFATDGTASTVLSNGVIDAFLGGSGPAISDGGLLSDGTYVFEELDTDGVLGWDGATVTTVISNAVLEAGQGGDDDIDSSIAGTSFTNLFWGNSVVDGVMMYDGATVTTAIPQAAILDELGFGSDVIFSGDMFLAPDGLIYFRVGDAPDNAILSFDPSDPVGTLDTVLSNGALFAGPFGDDNVANLSWYDGRLAFTGFFGGYYAIPEPTAGVILGLVALLGVANRSRR